MDTVGKVMSLLFNMLSRLVIASLPRSKRLLISWLQAPSAVTLEPRKIKSVTTSIFTRMAIKYFICFKADVARTNGEGGQNWDDIRERLSETASLWLLVTSFSLTLTAWYDEVPGKSHYQIHRQPLEKQSESIGPWQTLGLYRGWRSGCCGIMCISWEVLSSWSTQLDWPKSISQKEAVGLPWWSSG